MAIHNKANNINRRQFLGTAITGLGSLACHGLAESAVRTQAPRAPTNLKIGTERKILQASDIRFLGWFRLPVIWPNPGYSEDFMFAGGAFTSRTSGSRLRFLAAGSAPNGYPLVEFADPEDYSANLDARTPMAPLVTLWGDCYGQARATASGAATSVNGYFWDGSRLWWQYGLVYAASNEANPCLGCTTLDDPIAGRMTVYGPWRMADHAQKCRTWLLPIPSSFADRWCPSMRYAVGADQYSGIQASPFGPNLRAIALPPVTTPPSDVRNQSDVAIATKPLIDFDIQHRYVRPYPTFRGGDGPYNCQASSPDVLSLPVGTGDTGGSYGTWHTETDRVINCAWIETPTKHGVVWFGVLVRTIPGYSAPGDPHGLVHCGYGDPFGIGPDGAARYKTCCHGQDDPYWLATGPWCHARVPHVFIADPADLAQVASGARKPWEIRCTSIDRITVTGFNPSNHPSGRASPHWAGGMVWDAARSYLFVPINGMDTYSGTRWGRWAVAVFQIT